MSMITEISSRRAMLHFLHFGGKVLIAATSMLAKTPVLFSNSLRSDLLSMVN